MRLRAALTLAILAHSEGTPAPAPTLAPLILVRRATLLVHDINKEILERTDLGNGVFDVDPAGIAEMVLSLLDA